MLVAGGRTTGFCVDEAHDGVVAPATTADTLLYHLLDRPSKQQQRLASSSRGINHQQW